MVGYIELRDGTSRRRIWVPALDGEVRLETVGEEAPSVVVPKGVAVKRLTPSQTRGLLVSDRPNIPVPREDGQ